MLGNQASSGAPCDIPKLVNKHGKVSELVETNDGYVTCYTQRPLSNGEKLDFKCEQWIRGLSEIFLSYEEPTSESKLSAGPHKITLKSASFTLEIKDGKLKVIEKEKRSGKGETLNVEKEPCWVCFRLKRSRIKILGPALSGRTTSVEQSESSEQTDESDPVVPPSNPGPSGRPKPPFTRSSSLPVLVFERIKVIDEKLDELKRKQDTVDATVGDLKVQQETLTTHMKSNQVELNKHLAMHFEVQGQINELKQEKVETLKYL